MSGCPTNFENRRGWPTWLAVGEARGCLNVYFFFLPLFYRRLEIFSQRVVKQPTNRLLKIEITDISIINAGISISI